MSFAVSRLERLSRRSRSFGAILVLSLLWAACEPLPGPTPEVKLPPVTPRERGPVDYLRTLSGGWRIRLSPDHRWVEACQYGLTVGPTRRFDRTLYLRVFFENPLDRSSPLVTDTKIEPGRRELAIRSGEVRGLRKGGRYAIRIHIFDDPERRNEIGFHDQMMPARLTVRADGSVSF